MSRDTSSGTARQSFRCLHIEGPHRIIAAFEAGISAYIYAGPIDYDTHITEEERDEVKLRYLGVEPPYNVGVGEHRFHVLVHRSRR